MEGIACIGMNHFYSDQPELSLRFYRRLLQMGVNNAELFNNLGLCCFYAQQYDMTLACMERALSLATDDTEADVWSVTQLAMPGATSGFWLILHCAYCRYWHASNHLQTGTMWATWGWPSATPASPISVSASPSRPTTTTPSHSTTWACSS